jgi:nitrogen PTS system EIIA component
MELSVRNAAVLLGISEKTIYRLIEGKQIPAYKVNERYQFNHAELLEWANTHHVSPPASLIEVAEEGSTAFTLGDALRAGGVFFGIKGHDVPSVLNSVVTAMPLPEKANREFLLQMLLARESAGSTGIGDGVAIPHARNPIVMYLPRPLVSLCYLEQPIDFGAIDGKPVHTLFTIVSPTIKTHIGLLSRLAFALRDATFAQTVALRSKREAVFSEAGRIDGLLVRHEPERAASRP